MTAAGSRIAVLLEDGFDGDALESVLARLDESRLVPVLIGPVAGRTYLARDGRTTRIAAASPAGVARDTLAGVVIPAGYAADRLRLRHAVLDLVRNAVADGAPVGAVGHGAQVLISAGVIGGRTVTCWPSIAVDVKNAGALYVDRPVVTDDGVITARKADDAAAFVAAMLLAIERATAPSADDTIP
jgi:protease I